MSRPGIVSNSPSRERLKGSILDPSKVVCSFIYLTLPAGWIAHADIGLIDLEVSKLLLVICNARLDCKMRSQYADRP